MRLITWFNWLTGQGIETLEHVDQELCDRHLEEQSWSHIKFGLPRWRLDPETMAKVPRAMQVLPMYRELLSTDAYAGGFVPWDGRPPWRVVGGKKRGENATPPVPDELLQPLLATCLYLVEVVGPHLAEVEEARRQDQLEREHLPLARYTDLPALQSLCEEIRRCGEPLPMISERSSKRWAHHVGGELQRLSWAHLVTQAGFSEITDHAKPLLRPTLTALVKEVGLASPWARDAATIARHGSGELIPWTRPLASDEARFMAGHVLTACLVVTAALSGMRSSELLELQTGCRNPARPTPGGGRRFRLSGRLIKGQKFGGTPDEWVVIEEVDRAAALAERLVGRSGDKPLFSNVGLGERLKRLRKWLKSTGLGAHWGLPEIPVGPCTPRMLRRTLALSIAQRPGGLLAAKVALKHISVATTEGYAARPGGSQRLFLAEVEAAEEETQLALTVEAFREFENGQMPAGPGARSLIELFTHIDAELHEAARMAPKILEDDAHLESLLRKQAACLHVGPANFCWFRDPSKALCLKLAGTPNATKPLIGMCDSARCPQATHHPCHRPVWARQADTIEDFITNRRVAKGERKRLEPERDRALRVVAEIDSARSTHLVGAN
ncbi:hypothetical protein ACFV19_11580 [Streptomyces griseoluteus]|uniref:hypothetical protein n=1 Tax=Streptomyces griseoluteus TaxID=29306 RepID=UPI0036B4A315